METVNKEERPPLKLNYKRTFVIGFAFFGILPLWGIYNNYCANFLSEMFKTLMYPDIDFDVSSAEATNAVLEVQYLVGIIMALDNVFALVMLPIFGNLSDKTHSKIGKRMPFILIGTFIAAIAFPFIPLFYYWNNIVGLIITMVVVIFFMMMYRNPAVALMPDITPKPLRSRANGIINLVGYIGAIVGAGLGMLLPFTKYLSSSDTVGRIWIIETPFLIASILMVVTCLVLFFKIKENKIEEEMADDMRRGEEEAAVADAVTEDAPMSKANKKMLILILAAEVLWFMSFNAIETFMSNYTLYYLNASTGSSSIATAVLTVCSLVTFIFAGRLADKIGRKWTIVLGLSIIVLALLAACFVEPLTIASGETMAAFPWVLYVVFAFAGIGWALVNCCSFPMVVELCPKSKIGKFTGYYYTASMLAQSVTPILIGLLFKQLKLWQVLPIYSTVLMAAALVVFLFVKNIKSTKASSKVGIEALDQE
jgi:maltose/moltooligosaccharide transporter